MALPKQFEWLNTIGTLPKMLAAGLQYLGVREIPGMKSNPVIMDMAKGLGVSDIYKNDDMSWCAVFINHLIRITGKPMVNYKNDKYNLLRALWLLNWGEEVELEDIRLGDLVILSREGGGHVTIFIAFTKKGNFIGYGGNQGNQTSFGEFDPKRIKGIRRYYATGIPESAKQYIVSSAGILSTNES